MTASSTTPGEPEERSGRPTGVPALSLVPELPPEPESQAEPWARLPAWLRAMRPLQWSKNLLVFAALLFTRQVFEWNALIAATGAFVAFCAVSSAIYLLNDLRDVEQDRLHPEKRFRPLAAGELMPRTALLLSTTLLLFSLLLASAIRPELALVIGIYAVTMIAYTFGLKRVVILDVILIASGFVLRAAGGAVALDVPISPWLYLCTLLLALLMGFGKRRHELTTLQELAGKHRANLEAYSVPLLDQIIAVTAGATLVAYAVYTFDSPTLPANHAMLLTVPFVIYAVLRYLFLLYRRQQGGSPEVMLVTDKPLLAGVVLWALVSAAILYLA